MKQSDTESSHPIPYKYIDADNKIYKDPYLNNNNQDSSEEASGKQSDNMSPQNIKKSKFLNKGDMSEDELYELIEEKNGQLIELNKKTKKLKAKLTSIIKMLNEKIAENAEILYKKDINPIEFQWLTEQYEAKRRTLLIEQKINHSYKIQYNILENKLKNRNSVKEMKNANLLSKIASKENDINTNRTHSMKSNSKTNLMNGRLYMNIEDQINIIRNENKDILNKINEIKNKKILQKKEVDVIISGDLESQLKSKVEELQQIKLLKEDAIAKFNSTNRSIEMMNKKVEHFEAKINEINQNEYEDEDGGQGGGGALDNYVFWLEIIKDEITNRNQEKLLELIKDGNSNFINELKKAKELKKRKKKKKMLQDGSTDMNNDNNNNDKNENNKKQNKNIYKLFSILSNNKQNSNKESNDDNENLIKLTENKNIFNDFTDLEYRELLNKKEEYLETNMRLDNNIKNFAKTKNSKLNKITKSLKLKETQLKIIKEKNQLVQAEVNNLENIYQLSLEKEKIRKEIEKKMNKNKRKENMNTHNSPDILRKNKTIEKNLNIIDKINLNGNYNPDSKTSLEINDYNYRIRNLSTIKKVRKDNDIDETNSDNYFPETREEQLQIIKKKYIEDENNNEIENQNEEFLHVIENDNNSENKSNEGENDDGEDEKIEDNNNDINIGNKKRKKNDDNKNYDDEEIGQINYKALKLEQAPFKI